MSTILRIPTLELLRLWSELDDALHGRNGFGGSTAKIYAARFGAFGVVDYSTGADTFVEVKRDARRLAGRMLHELLSLFATERHALVEIGDREVGPWLADEEFDYHDLVWIRVTRRESKP